MGKNLVIVESPAKAKTIERYLGKEFVVKSCFGHIRDLKKKDIGIDFENNFSPDYIIPTDKKKIVNELKKLAAKSEVVWLATDEDREGEAIAWHLYEVLGLNIDNTKRIVFHEITKDAILNAIEKPRDIDVNLVDAQQARRVLDRIVGYEISPILWRKIKPALSAGRVQSVSVKLIVERERDVEAFESSSAFRVIAIFEVIDVNGKVCDLKAELPKRFATHEEAKVFLEKCKSAEFTINNIETKPSKRSPAAPFTTSTLQQEAGRKLGYSVAQTMSVAQRLYENGHITYMRTDSVNLSNAAIGGAKAEIISQWGEDYLKTRKFATKSKGAQEAHEAIRPTFMNNHTVDAPNQEQRLYELIWKRTIASQMSEAKFEKTTVSIDISDAQDNFVATGEVLKFDGFLKVYLESTDDDVEDNTSSSDQLLPPMKVKEKLRLMTVTASERFTNHPPRYTEASLVRKLEELGIGRPSTYAPTISTIQNRDYVRKEDRDGYVRDFKVLELKDGNISDEVKQENTGAERAKLFPTDIGTIVNDFLVEHFDNVMNYNFTASVEAEFDEIAEGKKDWTKMLGKFYTPFHKNVEVTLETSEKSKGERVLGVDPKSGKPLSVKIGRYGPIAQIGEVEDEDKPQFASLQKDQQLSTITFEEALDLFKLPRTIGEYEGNEVVIGIGRFGPYVRHDGKFISLKKDDGDDPMTIELPRATELIIAKRTEDANKTINTFGDILVLNGRYGPYISFQKKNFRIPKGTDAEALTEEECKKIIEAGPTKRGKKK